MIQNARRLGCRQGQDYYLKPMNCPMHNLIFGARGRQWHLAESLP